MLYGTTLASQKDDVECDARISQALCLTVSVDELLYAVQQTTFMVANAVGCVAQQRSRVIRPGCINVTKTLRNTQLQVTVETQLRLCNCSVLSA